MKTKMLRRGDKFTLPDYAQVVEVDEVNELCMVQWKDEKQDLMLQAWVPIEDLRPLFNLPGPNAESSSN
jgi:hypothetical protein